MVDRAGAAGTPGSSTSAAGAGLPGIALALARPDLAVSTWWSRCSGGSTFLAEVVAALELDGQVRVVRGRAEARSGPRAVGGADWVTARAVAPLDRLVGWCLPLLGRAAGCWP